MKIRFIHADFELDVSNLQLVWTEENTWFKDEFFLNSSFPFEIDFDRIPFFQKYRHLNAPVSSVQFQGKLEKSGKLEDAILEVEEAGEKLQLVIRYGTEALPNWNKNISEIELEVVLPDGGNMITLAEQTINKTYPEVNYNFPAVHSEFYKDAPMYEYFEGIINKRVNGSFILNTQNFLEVQNRNIVYPLPYHLYVLRTIIEQAGYTLHGDILTDPDFQDAIIIPGKKAFEFENLPEPVEWSVTNLDVDPDHNTFYAPHYISEMELLHRGNFHLLAVIDPNIIVLKVKLNGETIFFYKKGMDPKMVVTFETDTANNLLEAEVITFRRAESWVIDFLLKTNHLYDSTGARLPFLANFSKIQLADKLPDMTVGDFMKFHKRIKNYDFDLRNNNEIWMNKIENEMTGSDIVDVMDFEPTTMTRKFEQPKSFILRYEGEYEGYSGIFVDGSGMKEEGYEKNENTQDININGLPLPLDTKAGVTTAIQLTDDASKLMLTKYNGLVNGENWSQEMRLDCKTLYYENWQQWLNFMIHSTKFIWKIKAHPNLLMQVGRKSKLFAFNNLFFVFSLNRTHKRNVEEIEIEAHSTKV